VVAVPDPSGPGDHGHMTTARDILENLHIENNLDPESYPERQNHGVVVLLDQDPLLARLVAVWPNVPRCTDPDPDEEMPPEVHDALVLRWLWSRLEPDPVAAWIATAGLVDRPDIRKKCWVAIENKMVFPDGTRSRWAQQFVTQRVREAL